MDDDLLPIGRFARLAGLSVGALRHYDEVDLLRPARVDPATGYRSYRRDQLDDARTIVRLRELETPVETIRAFLAADDPGERRRLVDGDRRQTKARTVRLQRVERQLGQMTMLFREPVPGLGLGRVHELENDVMSSHLSAVGHGGHLTPMIDHLSMSPCLTAFRSCCM